MSMNLGTLLGQMIATMMFVWFCMRYVWPPLINAIEERQNKISEGLSAADRANKDLELAQQQVAEKITEAKEQANTIVEQANKRATQIVEEAKTKAEEEASRVKQSAQIEIEAQYMKAKSELASQVGDLVVLGAEKVVGKSVDKAANEKLFEELIAKL